ncbi:MAG: diaminobutyrate--2-oxoglutarate transaminase [Verrucomicrobia bacterium]|nr:diaminobutyrate--2-oxoglutarate transaminase [Verrucomicrobiota bacterium]MCH8527640.1 diaminobutyrate--2-oxoglutarate transaminase [Kiritimatiellia bacterium]
MKIFEELESEVRSYARNFPRVFHKAEGEYIYDENGKQYIDFLSGAGALNYGHNHPVLKKALLDYIQDDGITHSLDLHTAAKRDFMEAFRTHILQPRKMDHRMMFTGPTGTNAVEAALKLARKITKRTHVVAFTNGWHGQTLGALSMTANSHHRNGAGLTLAGAHRIPYDGYLGDHVDTTEYLDKVLTDTSSGVDLPAAVIVETVQGEGGVNYCSREWLQNLSRVCKKHDVLLIIDDIQAGCGRTGRFFSFEEAGIQPDFITLSKSLSGYGLPCAVVLFKPELDVWSPGEHNGTFRGNNHAFVTARATLDEFWANDDFAASVREKGAYIAERLDAIVEKYGEGNFNAKGRGMFQGINCVNGEIAGKIAHEAYTRGLIIETSGTNDEIIKLLCPLTIQQDALVKGIDIIEASVKVVCSTMDEFPEDSCYFDEVILQEKAIHPGAQPLDGQKAW